MYTGRNNPNDRREHLLRVTEKAKLVVPQIIKTFETINAGITRGIPAADMIVFESVLQQMQNNIKPFTTGRNLNASKMTDAI